MSGTILIGDKETGQPLTPSEWSDRTDFFIKHAVNQIKFDYGDNVKIAHKKLFHPGVNTDLDTGNTETIWLQGGDETYVSDNSIDTISSSSTSDTGEVLIDGHTVDGSGNFSTSRQTVTLTGQTKALLGTALARVDFIKNNSDTNWAGDVYVYEDTAITTGVPDDATKVHAKGTQSRNRSFKAAMTAGHNEYLILTNFFATVARKNAANVDYLFEIREKNKIFITEQEFSTGTNGGPLFVPFRPFLIIPKNADMRIRATANSNNTEAVAGFQGVFAFVK